MFDSFDPTTAVVTLVVAPLVFYILRRLLAFLRAHAGEFLDAAFYALGRTFRKSLVQRVSLRRYCRTCLAKSSNKYLQVPGKSPIALETARVFVPLRLRNAGGEISDITSELLSPGTRIRIVGDPGSGKTSLVKSSFRRLLQRALHRRSAHKLPLLIELKEFVPPRRTTTDTALGKWAYGALRDSVGIVDGFDMDKLFDSYSAGPGLAVLLDGLDEVSSDEYPRVSRAIRELSKILSNKSQNNSIVLTMRVQFNQQVGQDFDADFPPVCYIQPFSPTDTYKFLRLWPFDESGESNVTRIYNELTDRPTIREMCSNPLVLAMYVANDQEGRHAGGAPDTRTAFYSNVVEELLVRRRSRQLGTQARSMLREQRETLLGRLARENLSDPAQPANSLSWAHALDVVQEVLGVKADLADAELRKILNETGIMAEERPGESFRFIHLTFCEFLAARDFSQGVKDGWKEMLRLQREFAKSSSLQLRSRLVEVIPFCIASISRAERATVLSELMPSLDTQTQGRCFLETQAYDHESWTPYRRVEAAALSRVPPDQWDEAWLRHLHLFNVVLTDELEWRRLYGRPIGTVREEFFAELVRSDKDRLNRVFSTFATTDPLAAFRLAEAVGVDLVAEQPALVVTSFGDPIFRSVAIQKFEDLHIDSLDDKRMNQWCAVLVNAGMSNDIIADKISERDPTSSQRAVVDALRPTEHWFFNAELPSKISSNLWDKRVILGPSMYTAALSIALARNVAMPYGGQSKDIFRLQELRNISAPGGLRPDWIFRVLGFVSILCGLSVSASPRGSYTSLGNLALAIFGLMLAYVGLCVIRYPTGRRFIYASLANIIPGWAVSTSRAERIRLAVSPRFVVALVTLRRGSSLAVELGRPVFVSNFAARWAEESRGERLRATLSDRELLGEQAAVAEEGSRVQDSPRSS